MVNHQEEHGDEEVQQVVGSGAHDPNEWKNEIASDYAKMILELTDPTERTEEDNVQEPLEPTGKARKSARGRTEQHHAGGSQPGAFPIAGIESSETAGTNPSSDHSDSVISEVLSSAEQREATNRGDSSPISSTDASVHVHVENIDAPPAAMLSAYVVDEDAEKERESRLSELEAMSNAARKRKRCRYLAMALSCLLLVTAVIVASLVATRKGTETFCGDGDRGNGTCRDENLCCSELGYCGATTAYCGEGVSDPAKIFCGNGTRGINGTCSDSALCCSAYGWCGRNEEHCTQTCGAGIRGDGICPDGSCCSIEGWCGTTDEHCNGKIDGSGGRNLRYKSFYNSTIH